MKEFTDQQVKDIIKLKFGGQVTGANHTSYVSNRILGKLYGVSSTKIRKLYLTHFAEANKKNNHVFNDFKKHRAKRQERITVSGT